MRIFRVEILLIVFITLITIFSLIYKIIDKNLSWTDVIFLSASSQTFTGANIPNENIKLKRACSFQIIISYIFVIIILYNTI
jgi:hypothetical protein